MGTDSWFDVLLTCLGKPPLYTTVRVNTIKTTVDDAKVDLESVLEKVWAHVFKFA